MIFAPIAYVLQMEKDNIIENQNRLIERYGRPVIQQDNYSCVLGCCSFITGKDQSEIRTSRYFDYNLAGIFTLPIQPMLYLNSIGQNYLIDFKPIFDPYSILFLDMNAIANDGNPITHAVVYLEDDQRGKICMDPYIGLYKYLGINDRITTTIYPVSSYTMSYFRKDLNLMETFFNTMNIIRYIRKGILTI